MNFKSKLHTFFIKLRLQNINSNFLQEYLYNYVSDGTHDVFTKNNELPHNLGSSLFLVKTFFSNLLYIIVLFFYKFFEFRF